MPKAAALVLRVSSRRASPLKRISPSRSGSGKAVVSSREGTITGYRLSGKAALMTPAPARMPAAA